MVRMRRVACLLLTLVMVIGMLPMSVFATENVTETAPVAVETISAVDSESGALTALEDPEVVSDEADTLSATGTPVVVITASDFQKSSMGEPSDNTQNILNRIVEDYTKESGVVKGFIFGGDYSQSINDASTTSSGINDLKDVVNGVYGTDLNEVFVQGNHDAAVSALSATGAHDTDYYGVFSINEDDFPSGGSVSNTMLTNLKSYLNAKVTAGYKKPVFVVTHLPLHKTSRYDSSGTGASIFNVLNEAGGKGLNIIFLFGHNHSRGYDAYLGNASIYLPKGDSITVDGGGTETLNFTYANYGYVGYVGGSGGCMHLTMTTFEIYEDEVIVKRYDEDGLHNCNGTANVLKAAGGGSAPSGTSLNNTVYTSPQSITLTTPTGGSGDSDDSGDDNTGSGGTTGGSHTYELVTSIEAGEKYVIVGNDHPVALMDNGGSMGSQNVTISGTTMTSDVALTEWTISATSGGTIVSDKGNGLSYSSSSFNLTGAADNTFNIAAGNDDNFTILTVRTNSYYSKYYFNYDGSSWTSKPTSTAYVRLYKLTGTGGGTVNPSGGDWVTITEPDGGTTTYTYSQATSITQNGKYVIVGNDDDVALLADGTTMGQQEVTITGNSGSQVMTSTTELTEWTFSNTTSGTVYNGTNYLYSSSNGYTFRIDDSSDTLYFADNGNDFTIKASSSRTGYSFYYDGSDWATSGRNTAESVRLFQLTKSVPGDDATPGLFAKITGKLEYNVERGLKDTEVLALVKAEIKGYEYTGTSAPGDDVTGTDITEKLEFVLDSNYDGAKAGEYAVAIKYNGVTLGIAKVIVPEVAITGYECDKSATVYKNSSKRVATGAFITVKYADDTTSTVPITVSMLTDANGNAVSTAEVGSFEVFVNYNGQQFPFTLNVVEKVINDYPEYPEPGAIRFDKTAVAQGSFSKSGIAKVELSMTGVPYGSIVPTDVVIMVDMTTSMEHYGYVDDANAAIKAMLEALVYDSENDVYDDNIFVQVWTFRSDADGVDVIINNDLPRTNIPTEEDLKAAKAAIAFDTGLSTDEYGGSGTCYDAAAKKMYDLVVNSETENVVAVFASDGGPSRYAYLNDDNGISVKEGQNASVGQDTWFNDDGSVTDDYLTEYYTYQLKSQDPAIPVYTVGVGIDANTPEAHILEHMSSEYDASGKAVSTAPANATTSYFALADINSTPDSLSTVFTGIAASVREAATDVVVEDKIDSHYTMNFSLPNDVTAAEAGMEDFYMQVLSYELDDHNNRKADPNVLEKFLFNSDGTITHIVGGTACGENCSHVAKTGTTITGIDGTYFDYEVDANGDEFLTWTAEKLDRNELALEYFVYLDHSAGEKAADQVAPGTYPTNEYATISYTNFNNKRCVKEFPVPTMTWMGAKVTYVFYLVNEAGQPVNRAGKVIPFAEAIYVTDPVTYDVTWNEAESVERLSADYLADDLVPDVYELFDEQAYYELRVYQNETENSNYFQISGADDKLIDSALDTDTTKNNSTTKVYNTKAGTKYDEYGVYSQQAVGSVLDTTYVDENGNETAGTITTTVKTDSIDYANTTVAFAVVWKPELHPDTVVVDYGLDVVIDVTTNDALASGVTGVSISAPDGVLINNGSYQNSVMPESADILVNNLDIGTAEVEDMSSVRFSLDKSNGMQFTSPADFFYESACEYYINNESGEPVLNMAYMYSSVTVIPATTIYYEDEYVTLNTYTDPVTVENADGTTTTTYTKNSGWDVSSVKATATQNQDRPGESQISADIDADNNYGYDSAYAEQSTYSMGNAAMVHVDENAYATAEFTFYGTGFDIISLTSNTTGVLAVKVTAAEDIIVNGTTQYTAGTKVKSAMVNTYYGYKYEDGKWVATPETENALYQVPVMQIEELPYGKYNVVMTATYASSLDKTGDGGYDLYLDAIRIYDPTGNKNETANNAYVKDHEGWPSYIELRNNIIAANAFETTTKVEGMVFIDGDAAVGTQQMSDYQSYGPNNEVYLAAGQSVAFILATPANLDQIHIGMKSADGNACSYEIYNIAQSTTDKVSAGDSYHEKTGQISTATDMYYDITGWKGDIVVIENTGESGILSLTNIKTTYTSNPNASTSGSGSNGEDTPATAAETAETEPAVAYIYMTKAAAQLTVDSMNGKFDEDTTPDETVPEETEPETTVPEETEPEETEPEVTEPETFAPEISVKLNKTSVKVGQKVQVKVTTSGDVAYLTVNGETVTKYSVNRRTGERSWSLNVTAAEAGQMTIEVIAYNDADIASDAVIKTVNVTKKSGGFYGGFFGSFFGWIFG